MVLDVQLLFFRLIIWEWKAPQKYFTCTMSTYYFFVYLETLCQNIVILNLISSEKCISLLLFIALPTSFIRKVTAFAMQHFIFFMVMLFITCSSLTFLIPDVNDISFQWLNALSKIPCMTFWHLLLLIFMFSAQNS